MQGPLADWEKPKKAVASPKTVTPRWGSREGSAFASSAGGGNAAYRERFGAPANAGAGEERRGRRLLGNAGGDINAMRGLAGNMAADYRSTFRPLQQRMADTAELDGQSMADQASVDVSAAFDRSLDSMTRDLSRMGINPSSGRFAGMQQQWGRAKAAASAGAMTRARRTAQSQNFSRLLQATNVGLNNATGSANMYGNAGSASQGLANEWGDLAYGASYRDLKEKEAAGGSLQDSVNGLIGG